LLCKAGDVIAGKTTDTIGGFTPALQANGTAGPITLYMVALTHPANRFALLSRTMAKSIAAKLRGIGVLPEAVDWVGRAGVCERCPLRVVVKGASYCGKPFLQQIDRDPAVDGCGCSTRDKAKAAEEHCPIDGRHQPARTGEAGCTCKWCVRNTSAVGC